MSYTDRHDMYSGLRIAENPRAEQGNHTLRTPERHPWSSCHHCRTISMAFNHFGGRHDRKKNVPQLEVLASLQRKLLLALALRALETQDNLLGSLGLPAEDGLGLTSVTLLLSVVTTLTLGVQRGLEPREKLQSAPIRLKCDTTVQRSGQSHLSGLVLGDLVLGVLVAVLGLAERPAGFRNVDLVGTKRSASSSFCFKRNR